MENEKNGELKKAPHCSVLIVNQQPGEQKARITVDSTIASDYIEQLKSQMQDMQLEINLLKETINA